jgi:hypothetical protein
MPIKTPQETAFALWKNFVKSQKMSDFFIWFSHEVWESQKFGRFAKTHEEELTNLMVRSLMQAIYYGTKQAFPIRIFHAANEKTNGRDLEIIYQLAPNKNIKFYCQAKRLYTDKTAKIADAKYEALSHADGTYSQIESLIAHSKDGGYPLYLFYNYDEAKTDYNYGCTLVSAYYLYKLYKAGKDLSKLKFKDLLGIVKPLTSLDEVKDIACVEQWEGRDKFKAYVTYFDDKIFDNPKEKKWQEFLKLRDVTQGASQALAGFLKATEADDRIFSPRYRIVITQTPIKQHQRLSQTL